MAVVVEEQRVVPVECPSVLLGGRLELVWWIQWLLCWDSYAVALL